MYILATECSKPAATKAETGNNTAEILSVVVRAPSETDEHVAQDAKKQRAIERECNLVVRQLHCDLGDFAVPGEALPRQQHKQGGSQSTDEVAGVDDGPCSQHLAQPDLAGGPCHDHQGVSGEQLGATHDNQDQPETEHHTCEKAADTERDAVACSGEYRRCEHATEADEGAG